MAYFPASSAIVKRFLAPFVGLDWVVPHREAWPQPNGTPAGGGAGAGAPNGNGNGNKADQRDDDNDKEFLKKEYLTIDLAIPINRRARIIVPSPWSEKDWDRLKQMLDIYIEGWKEQQGQGGLGSG